VICHEISVLNGFAAHIAAIEHSLTSGRVWISRKSFSVHQSGAVRRHIAMGLREILALGTRAPGTIPVANYVLVTTFLNFHRSLPLALDANGKAPLSQGFFRMSLGSSPTLASC
jgi:hypothetical protein